MDAVSWEAMDLPDSRLELREGARSDWKKEEREFLTSGSSLSVAMSSRSDDVNNADKISGGGGLGSTSGIMGGGVGGVDVVDGVGNFPASGVVVDGVVVVGGGDGGGVDGDAMVGVTIDTDGEATSTGAATAGEIWPSSIVGGGGGGVVVVVLVGIVVVLVGIDSPEGHGSLSIPTSVDGIDAASIVFCFPSNDASGIFSVTCAGASTILPVKNVAHGASKKKLRSHPAPSG